MATTLSHTNRTSYKEPTGLFFLHQRRSAIDLPALRQLEVRFLGAACSGAVADLGQSLHQLEGPEDIQSPDRSLRAGGRHVEHILRLAHRSRLPLSASAGVRGPIPSHVQ